MKSGGRLCRPLVEFSYVSRVAEGLPADAVLRIAQTAWSFNRRMRITGTLHFDQGHITQLIEGEAPVLLALAARIMADPRHRAIAVRGLQTIASRRFSDWQMHGLELPEGSPGLVRPSQAALRSRPRVLFPASTEASPASVAGRGGR